MAFVGVGDELPVVTIPGTGETEVDPRCLPRAASHPVHVGVLVSVPGAAAVWQRFASEHSALVVSVAADTQGRDRVFPYLEKAGWTGPSALDEENVLGGILGYKAIPNAVFVDEDGVVRYARYAGFDIRKPEGAEAAEAFVRGEGSFEGPAPESFADPEALELFRRGAALLREGDRDGALAAWRKGMECDPENWVIRKQIWALEHPERFYDGDVDFAWQFERIEAGE